MDKQALLKQKAIEFHKLLEEYADADADVARFLGWFEPWFKKINNNEITPPCLDYKLFAYFANPDLSPLTERYMGKKLGQVSSEFTAIIFDW